MSQAQKEHIYTFGLHNLIAENETDTMEMKQMLCQETCASNWS